MVVFLRSHADMGESGDDRLSLLYGDVGPEVPDWQNVGLTVSEYRSRGLQDKSQMNNCEKVSGRIPKKRSVRESAKQKNQNTPQLEWGIKKANSRPDKMPDRMPDKASDSMQITCQIGCQIGRNM